MLGTNGEAPASASGTLLRNPADDTVPERTVSLKSATFQGIAAVRFGSDPRLNGVPFADRAGEVWRSDFGTEVSGALEAAARDSLDRWEPRAVA